MGRLSKLKRQIIEEANKRRLGEVSRSTWNRAAELAKEKGFGSLEKSFYQHGKEMGDIPRTDDFTIIIRMGQGSGAIEEVIRYDFDSMDYNHGDGDFAIKLRPLEIAGDPQDKDSSLHRFEGSIYGGSVRLFGPNSSDKVAMLGDMRSAKNFLRILGEKGVAQASEIDPRSITKGKAAWEDIYGDSIY